MDRNNLHHEIASLSDKIKFLNERLSSEQKLHPVEMDLLAGYAKELNSLILQLAGMREHLLIVQPGNEAQSDNPVISEKAIQEKRIQPQAKSDEELKLHQHISANEEKPTNAEEMPPIEQMRRETVMPEIEIVDMTAVEEVAIRQKTEVALSVTVEKKNVSLNDRFKTESKPLSEKLKSAKKNNLKELFDINERYLLIQKLFGGSADTFNKTLHDLGKCPSHEEAEIYLKDVEENFGWRDQEEHATRFKEQVMEMMNEAKAK